MNNTIETAVEFYINNMQHPSHVKLEIFKKNVRYAIDEGFDLNANINVKELAQLMVDYHNALIQSKIEELEKEMELLDKQDKNLVLLKLMKRNVAINYLKVMQNESI
jgi:uncharacterized protein (UPF0128 family)